MDRNDEGNSWLYQIWYISSLLRPLPPSRQPARQQEEADGGGEQHQNLGPEVSERLLAPEDLQESIDRPGVDGPEAKLLDAFGEEITRHHASAHRRHDEDDEIGQRDELHARAGKPREDEAEARCSKACRNTHDQEAPDMAVELDAEEYFSPNKHDRELEDRDGEQVEKLPEQQRRHRHTGREDAIQRAALGFFDEGATRSRGGEEQKHHAQARGEQGGRRVLFRLAEHVFNVDVEDPRGLVRCFSR